eukprot:7800830-Alexandrium_andersonii.AAC.1
MMCWARQASSQCASRCPKEGHPAEMRSKATTAKPAPGSWLKRRLQTSRAGALPGRRAARHSMSNPGPPLSTSAVRTAGSAGKQRRSRVPAYLQRNKPSGKDASHKAPDMGERQ